MVLSKELDVTRARMTSAFTSLNCLIIRILARRIDGLLPATQDLISLSVWKRVIKPSDGGRDHNPR
nr:MAG TPA: hypothetical protein [Caudoviricetes sp.]